MGHASEGVVKTALYCNLLNVTGLYCWVYVLEYWLDSNWRHCDLSLRPESQHDTTETEMRV